MGDFQVAAGGNHMEQNQDVTQLLLLAQTVLIQYFSDDSETLERLRLHGKSLESTFNSASVSYCLNQYIETELDFKSESNRGLGRITESVPRLGAFFRKKLSKLSTDNLDVLRTLIGTQCLLGYMTHVFFFEEEIADMKPLDGEHLYETWVPSIYSNNFSDISEDTGKLFAMCSQRGTNGLKAFFHDHNMKAGWLQSDDIPNTIITYYFIAGLCLRKIETKLFTRYILGKLKSGELPRDEREKFYTAIAYTIINDSKIQAEDDCISTDGEPSKPTGTIDSSKSNLTATKFCTNCGSSVVMGSKFCGECGQKVA